MYQHIVLGRHYEKGEEQLVEWFSDDIEKKGKKDKDESDSFVDDLEEKEPKDALDLHSQDEWAYLLSSKFKKPFFVYFTWRYDYEFQKMESDVVLWW